MKYQEPNFDLLEHAPLCTFQPAPADCVLPDGFMCTTNFPTYVHTKNGWVLARSPRMDAHLVLDPHSGHIDTREFRCIKRGDLIAIAQAEDGTEGVFVWEHAFSHPQQESTESESESFSFSSFRKSFAKTFGRSLRSFGSSFRSFTKSSFSWAFPRKMAKFPAMITEAAALAFSFGNSFQVIPKRVVIR